MFFYRFAFQGYFGGNLFLFFYLLGGVASYRDSCSAYVGVFHRFFCFLLLARSVSSVRGRPSRYNVSTVLGIFCHRDGVHAYVGHRVFSEYGGGSLIYVPVSRQREGSAASGISRRVVGRCVQLMFLVYAYLFRFFRYDCSSTSYTPGSQYQTTYFCTSGSFMSGFRGVFRFRILFLFLVRVGCN